MKFFSFPDFLGKLLYTELVDEMKDGWLEPKKKKSLLYKIVFKENVSTFFFAILSILCNLQKCLTE